MAGTFVHLRFSNRASSCDALVELVRAFAAKRMTFRAVTRLEGDGPVLGQRPHEWQESGVTPADLGLEDDEWYIDVVEASRKEGLTIDQALERWPIGPWVGVCLEYDLPPAADGFPDIYGACWWRIWFGTGGWRHSASIEYPTSSIRADERWPAWLDEFVAGAEHAFDAECERR